MTARPPGPARRAWRRLRRHRAAALAGAAIALVAATALTARAVVHARDADTLAARHRQFLTLRDRAAAALAGGRLDEALDAWSRAALLDGADAGLNRLGGQITEAALREELDAPRRPRRPPHPSHPFDLVEGHRAAARVRRPRAEILFGLRDLAVGTEPPGAAVTFRATRHDGRPIDLVLYRLRGGPIDRPAMLREVVPGDLWVTATDPATGAFAERPYHLPRDLNPGTPPPPLLLHLRPRGGPAEGMVRVARAGRSRWGPTTPGLRPGAAGSFRPISPSTTSGSPPRPRRPRGHPRRVPRLARSDPALGPRAKARWRAALWPSGPDPARDDWPITDVSHDLAVEFAAEAGCRLPTEEELEYAARGPASHRAPDALPGAAPRPGPIGWRLPTPSAPCRVTASPPPAAAPSSTSSPMPAS